MRQLWVQLSLAFAGVVIISAVLLSIVGNLGARAEANRFANNLIFADTGIIAELTTHFDEGGTLENAVQIIREEERDLRQLPIQINFQLLNNNNRVIAGQIPARGNFREITFEQDGQRIAILRYAINRDARPLRGGASRPQQAPSPDEDNRIALIVIIGSIIGIAGGIFMSRQLTKPLAQLADTARQFGTRDFSTRSAITGTQEVREVALAFNQMADAIQESETLRNNLIADTAHELRTPLSVMKGNLRAIIDDVYPLSKTEIMHLYEQTHHLSRLVNDLHELALADARELTLQLSETDMVNLLNEVADVFAPVAEADNISLTTDFRTALPSLMIDAGRIRQVIHNILVNALRYTSENGRVTIRAFQESSWVIIEIEDNGSGIPEAHLKHIFERLYRVDSARDRESGGTGLGLAIGKAIIEAHRGQITVRSQVIAPSGTCFRIALPIA